MLRRLHLARAGLIVGALNACLFAACGDDLDATEQSSETDPERDASTERDEPSTKTDAGRPADEPAAESGADKDSQSEDEDPPAKESDAKPSADEKPKANNDEKSAADQAKDDNVKVSLRFRAKVGQSDFACSHKYAGQGTAATTVTPIDLRFFVHAVALIKEDGTKVPLSLVAREPWQSETLALLDFEDKTGRCSEGTADTNTAITGSAPAGSYQGVSFTVGVPDELIHKDPASVAAPLKDAVGLAATGVEGFRFARIGLTQLNAAADASGSGLFDLGSSQCTGSVADGSVKCEKTNRSVVSFGTFDLAKNSVVIDVAKLFALVDLTQPQTCHSVEKSCAPMLSAFGVSFENGQPAAEQSVFSVE
ncbi:MAG TPA: MbnP family copper-binding protein [Polyangiales bacterium]|nr:MbnP family copper-binding protein [Polyangiales bacterium]